MNRREAVKTAVQTYLAGLESCGGSMGNVSAEAITSLVEGVLAARSETASTRDAVLEEAAKACDGEGHILVRKGNHTVASYYYDCGSFIRALKNPLPQVGAPIKAIACYPQNEPAAAAPLTATLKLEDYPSPKSAPTPNGSAELLLKRWYELYGGSTVKDIYCQQEMTALDQDTRDYLGIK